MQVRIVFVEDGLDCDEMRTIRWDSVNREGALAAISGALESLGDPVQAVLIEVRVEAGDSRSDGTFGVRVGKHI